MSLGAVYSVVVLLCGDCTRDCFVESYYTWLPMVYIVHFIPCSRLISSAMDEAGASTSAAAISLSSLPSSTASVQPEATVLSLGVL